MSAITPRFDINQKQPTFSIRKSVFWMREREERSLALFHTAAARVPAYRDFLHKNKVRPEKIKTFKDFQSLPWMTKENYLRAYPMEKLLWDGTVRRGQVFTVTSGSTGKPSYFPRTHTIERQSAALHKLFLDYEPYHKNESTLIIVCFGMGAWIGGLITYQAFRTIAEEFNYPISLFTPGPNKKEIFEGLKNIGPHFDHVILCGYPPFLKDIIDEAPKNGINWKKFDLRIVFAAEGFSEEFRDHMIRTAHIRNPYLGTMNIYGSADIGTMAEETPLAIVARRLVLEKPAVYKELFHNAGRLPTLAQFHPAFTSFEADGEEILLTGENALPLVRYAIGDHGGVMSFDELNETFSMHGIDIQKKMKGLKLEHTILELPFVYIYERSDMSTKLYGAIIYPEHIRHATHHARLGKNITGKFTMSTRADKQHNEYLEINVELRPGVEATEVLREQVGNLIQESLVKFNAEHRNNSALMSHKVHPRITLWDYEHPTHFRPGAKQKWVKKE